MTTKTTTRTIAGHPITLEVGRRYIASRPMAQTGRDNYYVRIADTDGKTAAFIPANLELADLFIAEFNNGKMSFDGRIWA